MELDALAARVIVPYVVMAAVLAGLALIAGLAGCASSKDKAAAHQKESMLQAAGFKVILRDVASNKEFVSEPTDAEGNYTAQVPVGGRYKLAGVVADDGVTKLAVQDVPPVSVLTPGTTRLNVRFTTDPAPAAPVLAAAPATDDKKSESAVPWYKRPGPITGMVLGGVAIVALLVAAGGGDDNPASPSNP